MKLLYTKKYCNITFWDCIVDNVFVLYELNIPKKILLTPG